MTTYYNYEDLPAYQKEGELPRLMQNGEWVRFYDLGKFDLYAQPISKQQFDAMVGEQQASGET